MEHFTTQIIHTVSGMQAIARVIAKKPVHMVKRRGEFIELINSTKFVLLRNTSVLALTVALRLSSFCSQNRKAHGRLLMI